MIYFFYWLLIFMCRNIPHIWQVSQSILIFLFQFQSYFQTQLRTPPPRNKKLTRKYLALNQTKINKTKPYHVKQASHSKPNLTTPCQTITNRTNSQFSTYLFLFSLGLGRSQSPSLGPKMNTKVAFNTHHHTKLFDQFQT